MPIILGHLVTGKQQDRRGYTYIKVGIGYVPPAAPPKSFAGVSGGGLWVVPTVVNSEGELDLNGTPVLAGVAFRQFQRGGVVKSIRCHGPQDIYGIARDTIAAKMKEREIWTPS